MRSNKKKIYIVRHGETDWNFQRRLQGCEIDIQINENGCKQSSITGKYLNDYHQKKNKFDIIYCSPLKRSIETACIIAKEIGYKKNKIIIINELKEICAGEMGGTTEEERKSDIKFKRLNELRSEYRNIVDPIKKTKKILFNEEQISKIYSRETLDGIHTRIKKVLDKIITDNNRKILIITHAGIIEHLYKIVGNTYQYKDGDVSNGRNCKIGYIEYNNSEFQIFTNPNTVHFSLYKDVT